MAEVFAKMSAGLDRSRKIRRAGRNGRDVFLYVLRKVADRNSSGWIPAVDVDDHEWLADELMCTVEEVEEGLSRAMSSGLLLRVDDRIVVAGWEDAWAARKPMSNAERQAKHREKSRRVTESNEGRYSVTDDRYAVTEPVTQYSHEQHGSGHNERTPNCGDDNSRVTAAVTSNESNDVTRRERRESEKRERESVTKSVTPVTPTPPLSVKIWEVHRQRHSALKAELNVDVPDLRPAGHATGWSQLRDRIASYGGDLAAAEQACLHVLDVREAEARRKKDLVYFGDKVWRDDQFTHAIGEKRPKSKRDTKPTAATETEFEHDMSWMPKEMFE